MKNKAVLISLAFLLLSYSKLNAQKPVINLYDSAQVYYKKEDFKKASEFFDIYYIEKKMGQSNYDTYKAAVASAHVGNLERAKYYLKRSAEIGYDYSEYDYFANDPLNTPLRNLPEWKQFIEPFKFKADSAMASLKIIEIALNDSTTRVNHSVLSNENYWKGLALKMKSAQLSEEIKQFKGYTAPTKNNFWTVYKIKVNDTLTVPFLLHIPNNYNTQTRTPLYVYLHGAVVNRPKFTPPKYIPGSSEMKIVDKFKDDAFVIYPFGRKTFGWLYQQEAFETILKEIAFVKSLYNINDNKVYIGGHSNGGSGAFWFGINQPTAFASFFGLNYYPKAYVGNTTLKNLNNSSVFYGVSGTKDTTFPLTLVNPIYQLGIDNGANWKNFTRVGNHGLGVFQVDSASFIFDLLAKETRNPFPKKIQWETDNVKNGRNAWIEISALDTLAQKADWQIALNPTVTLDGKETLLNFHVKKSGAVIATATKNHIDLKTSRVGQVKLYISADQFDFSKPLTVTINDKDKLSFKLKPDNNVIVQEFLKSKDRCFIVSNILEIDVKGED